MSAPTGVALWMVSPRVIELRVESLPHLGPDDLEIRATASALSHGTERLAYRGEIATHLPLDLPSFRGSFGFPLKYGYASVGEVVNTGASVSNIQAGDLVFALHPHQDRYVIHRDFVVPLPRVIPPERGLFFAQIETALTVLLDAQPSTRECVMVFGQGVVGLLVTALLARLDLERLIAVDPIAHRRTLARRWGAHEALAPSPELAERVHELTGGRGADVVIEVSGAPPALDQALNCAAVQGTLVVASWYGEKPVTLHLGSAFHRRRLRLVSSQVGMINPALAPRWDRARRTESARSLLLELPLESLISHRFPFERAEEAYALLESPTEETVQIALEYGSHSVSVG